MFDPSYFVSALSAYFGPLSYSTKNHEKKNIHNYLGKIFRDLICICVCAMRTEAQRCRRIDAGNVARMGRDSWASARSAREQCAQCAPRPSELGQQRPRQSLLSSARTGNTQLTYIYTSGLTLEIPDFEPNLSSTQPEV